MDSGAAPAFGFEVAAGSDLVTELPAIQISGITAKGLYTSGEQTARG